MALELDEFEKHARATLKNEPELVGRLLVLRNEIQREGDKAWSKSRAPSASMLNAVNRRMLDRAAALLGPANFERVFGFSPDQEFDLFDPDAMRAAKKRLQTPAKSRSAEPRLPRVSPAMSVVTLKDLAAELASRHAVSKKQAETVLADMVGRITRHLKKGDRVRLVGLGILQVRKQAARTGRNPATGDKIRIKAGKKVAFRAAKDLKESI